MCYIKKENISDIDTTRNLIKHLFLGMLRSFVAFAGRLLILRLICIKD